MACGVRPKVGCAAGWIGGDIAGICLYLRDAPHVGFGWVVGAARYTVYARYGDSSDAAHSISGGKMACGEGDTAHRIEEERTPSGRYSRRISQDFSELLRGCGYSRALTAGNTTKDTDKMRRTQEIEG